LTTPPQDDFALHLWAEYDRQKTERRHRPPDHPTAPSALDPDGLVVIGDPIKYATSALDRAAAEFASVGADNLDAPAGRNHALNAAAYSLGKLVAADPPLLDADTVRDTLLAACDLNGLRQWTGANACLATIDSGLRSGAKEPLHWTQGDTLGVNQAAGFASHIPTGAGTDVFASADPDALHRLNVTRELLQLRARDEARELLIAEKALRDFREPPSRMSVREELQLPDDPVTYAIDKVLPTGTNALLTAGFKTGKTTLVGDLAVAHADGTPFLGKFPLTWDGGRLAIFNYELSDSMYRRWLRELNLENPERLAVLHLRGFRLPVIVKHVEDWTVRWLVEHEVTRWVVDPFARAFTGCGSENDNGEVGRFLDTLDVIKERAGVSELILPTHTGRQEFEEGDERARGATRLDDWADVRWMLTKDDDDVRYFSATGRDVEEPEEKLTYDETTRRYVKEGGDRRSEASSRAEVTVLEIVRAQPGITSGNLRGAVGGKGRAVDGAVKSLIGRREIHIKTIGNAKCHYPGSGLDVAGFDPS
jgi:hypothetical protein